MKFDDLTTVPEYAGFVKSPQYQEWLKYLAKERPSRRSQRARRRPRQKHEPRAKKAGSGN